VPSPINANVWLDPLEIAVTFESAGVPMLDTAGPLTLTTTVTGEKLF